MKLLIFSIFLINLFFLGTGSFFLPKTVVADEIGDSYLERYRRWQQDQAKRWVEKEKIKKAEDTEKIVSEVESNKNKKVELPNVLPQKDKKFISELNQVSVLEQVNSQVKQALKSQAEGQDQDRSDSISTSGIIDAREEFISNIPTDNKQVQALLTMIDHTKTFFAINNNGALKDLFQDERFKEIYSEEMTKPTRKLTYLFFKGYQDANRSPNEPVNKKLDREIKVNREKVDAYLESSGIKSKLTRSLTGSYPKVPTKKEENIEPSSIQESNPTVN